MISAVTFCRIGLLADQFVTSSFVVVGCLGGQEGGRLATGGRQGWAANNVCLRVSAVAAGPAPAHTPPGQTLAPPTPSEALAHVDGSLGQSL